MEVFTLDSPDVNMVTDVLDALEIAKKAYALLPQMPSNMKSVHFRVLDAIYRTRDDTGGTRVSDINRSLGFLLPNTIRFINELVELNAVEKVTPASDKRVVLVRTTELGERYINEYVLKYQKLLEKEFSALGESNRKTMIEMIHKVYQSMKRVYRGNTNPYSFYSMAMLLLRPHRITVTTKTDGQKYLFIPGTAIGSPTDMLYDRFPLQHTYPDLETEQPLPNGTAYSLMYWQPDLQSYTFRSAVQNPAEIPASSPWASWSQRIDSEMQSDFGSAKGLSARTVALAQSITAGCSNEFQKAAAIERWLGAHCTYTLSPPQPRRNQDFVDYFLFDSRKGYCEHFATAMTMLLRASGVPARYVEGYASPSVSESGLYEVTNEQAHAWVEYYSSNFGFITADPTPASDLPATLTRAQVQERSSPSLRTPSASS